MIQLSEIPEMIEDLRKGDLLLSNVDSVLLDLLAEHEVQTLLVLLPQDLRKRFEEKLQELFANDVPPASFLFLNSARGDHPDKLEIIASARRWLKTIDLMPPSSK